MVAIRQSTLNAINQALHLKKNFLTLEYGKRDLGFFMALHQSRFLRGFFFFDSRGTGLKPNTTYVRLQFRQDRYGRLMFHKFLINFNLKRGGAISSQFLLKSEPVLPFYFIRTKYGILTQKSCMLLGCGGVLLLEAH